MWGFGYYRHEDNIAKRMQQAEQLWMTASQHLDNIIEHIREHHEQELYKRLENTDASALFEFMKNYIMTAEEQNGEDFAKMTDAHKTTILIAATALTRLVRDTRTDATLADLEKEINKP